MEELNLKGIEEMGRILRERGVPYLSGRLLATHTCRHTQEMLDWLNANPTASEDEMEQKAVELGRLP